MIHGTRTNEVSSTASKLYEYKLLVNLIQEVKTGPPPSQPFCTDTCLLVLRHNGSSVLERCDCSQNKKEVRKEAPHHLPEENGGTQQAVHR